MQVFLPYENDLQKSAQSLDDVRLNKQIVELCQILTIQYNIRYGKSALIGYADHPIVRQYHSDSGITFLLEYGYELCAEYWFRTGKVHQCRFTLLGIKSEYSGLGLQFKCEKSFRTYYIKGVKGKNQIITDQNVSVQYRNLLCEKWLTENPKWTRRLQPEFYVRPGGV